MGEGLYFGYRQLNWETPILDVIMNAVEICHLYISQGHNFVDHHGREPDEHPAIEVATIECVAGRGIRGDRYFDHKDDYKGQITFFSLEVFDELCATLQLQDCLPSLPRRNVITRNVDLNELIGNEFEVQGVRFYGTEESRPCHWMERVIAPGAKEFLKGRGGLRAKILSDGELRSTNPPVIPSEVEESRRETVKATSRDPSTSLRMTGA